MEIRKRYCLVDLLDYIDDLEHQIIHERAFYLANIDPMKEEVIQPDQTWHQKARKMLELEGVL
jgi:hypothetical protein